jgi:hypothetical protein
VQGLQSVVSKAIPSKTMPTRPKKMAAFGSPSRSPKRKKLRPIPVQQGASSSTTQIERPVPVQGATTTKIEPKIEPVPDQGATTRKIEPVPDQGLQDPEAGQEGMVATDEDVWSLLLEPLAEGN